MAKSPRFGDPQLAHRRTWRLRPHPEIGGQSYYFPGFEQSEAPGDMTQAAPVLGQDNDLVFREFLGLTDEEYRDDRSKGVI